MVVDGDITFADHFETVTTHYDGGILIESNTEQLGSSFDDLDQVELAVSSEQVLVDGGVAQKAETFFMIAHHDCVR